MDVGDFLRELGLQQYQVAFRDNRIDIRVLPKLTAEDLKDLGVTLVGDRRMLLDAITALREPTAPAVKPNFPTVTHPTAGMPQKTAGFYGRSRFVVLKITVLSEDIWH